MLLRLQYTSELEVECLESPVCTALHGYLDKTDYLQFRTSTKNSTDYGVRLDNASEFNHMALNPGDVPLLPRRRLPSCRWLRLDTDQLTVTPEGTRTSSFSRNDPRVTSYILVSEQFPDVSSFLVDHCSSLSLAGLEDLVEPRNEQE